MEYQHLTVEQRRKVIEDLRASRPTPEQVVAAAEIEHWRSCVRACIGLNDHPDQFVPPDTTDAAAEHAALDALEALLWQQ